MHNCLAKMEYSSSGVTIKQEVAVPVHVQHLQHALRLDPLLNYIDTVIAPAADSGGDTSTDTDADADIQKASYIDGDGNRVYNGIVVSKAERKADKNRLYNFSKVKKSRKWLKQNVLLSDSSSDEEDERPVTDEDITSLLEMHNYQKKCRTEFHKDKELQQYQYLSTGLLSTHDKYHEHQKSIMGPKKKLAKEQKKAEKKLKKESKKKQDVTAVMGVPIKQEDDDTREDGELTYEELARLQELWGEQDNSQQAIFHNVQNQPASKPLKNKKLTPEQIANKRRRLWIAMCKKEIPKAAKQKANARKEGLQMLKKVGKECQKECRKQALASQKLMKESFVRARRLSKEMQVYWKRFEKVEKEHRKKAEREAIEQRKVDMEMQEMKRQQRKLNFLITQTELYAHFMAKKLTGESEGEKERILSRLDEDDEEAEAAAVSGGELINVAGDSYSTDVAKEKVLKTAEIAFNRHKQKTDLFDMAIQEEKKETSIFANPSLATDDLPQPTILQGKLKGYQLKGMNWLASLYNQGINGILADEMGLGKTVQSIAFMAHLAEAHNIWGPFLVVAPASTLHNWQQELTKFVPSFKVVPYWGNTQDRKVLRKFWNTEERFYRKDSSFHIVVTSYQLIIQDAKYFHRIKWHYMVLDEAQAIKSSSSVRWKMLLGFNCRNRLLLTGTPIQNSMQELWALLHYIMPTLFDSHEEFADWFSKDIENHAERQSGIDEKHLSRLHMILKPFMLRRCKTNVENELSDKIEIVVYCPLTKRQRYLYQAVKNKIRIEDLLSSHTGSNSSQTSTSSLMNLVMQFRKVCNHPELFERREIKSPLFVRLEPYYIPKLVYREAILESSFPSKKHLLFNLLYIFNPNHIHNSIFHTQHSDNCDENFFSFSRFSGLTTGELSNIMLKGLLASWLYIFWSVKRDEKLLHQHTWQPSQITLPNRCMHRHDFLLRPLHTTSPASVAASPLLRPLVFTHHNSAAVAHSNITLHSMKETPSHRKIRTRRRSGGGGLHSPTTETPLSPTREKKHPSSPAKAPASKTVAKQLGSLADIFPHKPRPPVVLEDRLVDLPSFLYYAVPKVNTPGVVHYTSDRSAEWQALREHYCGTQQARTSLLYGAEEVKELQKWRPWHFSSSPLAGLYGIRPRHGYSQVAVPDKETMVTDAGKLYVLDTLLERLKQDHHRVLIYSQMTRMIDLLEEYMWHRKHTYMRLDGSSKISDRRDMVNDFQERDDIFVFLLSTRAGGLGINLTAADTVIFYDSDWNPTVDQQAMDRAHRLGQTKQVTVYRLICKGTIEERIVQRAKEKSEIQRMVIQGGNFKPDVLKPKEVVSLLLDDDELEKRLQIKTDEKKIDSNQPFKRKSKTGRGPGRPKKKKVEEVEQSPVSNQTIPASNSANDSLNQSGTEPGTPAIAHSLSEAQLFNIVSASGGGTEDSSNDGLVIVDDAHTTFPDPVGSTTPAGAAGTPEKPRGRKRGRPRGSTGPRRSRGRGSVKKAIMAAESAAAAAGKTAAFAAYGYSFQSTQSSPVAPSGRGASGRGRGRGVATRGGAAARGFYSPTPMDTDY